MALPRALRDLTGAWLGTKRVLLPGEPPHASPSAATLTISDQGRLLTLRYSWAFDGDPQEGQLAAIVAGDGATVAAAFMDTWHMGDQIMLCHGMVGAGGDLSIRGTYSVPDGPDWGWRIDLAADGAGLRLTMYNITPTGEEMLGVEALYTRAAS